MKGWRTYIFNMLSIVLIVLSIPELAPVLPKEWVPWLALGNAIGNLMLRTFTTTAPGHSS